jgi:prepilin-type N-terminal cleavage/methylation domain-containing protein
MAEDLMASRKQTGFLAGQRGFSMIEMLMTAFILAIGLLGLCMLQTLSLRAARGSRSLTTAVQIASGVLDQVESEGRVSWLNVTTSANAGPTLNDLPSLVYIRNPMPEPLKAYYNGLGGLVDNTSTDPAVKSTVFTVTTTQALVTAAAQGTASDFTVQVQFADATNAAQAPITRTVTLTRRIVHG